MEYNPFSASEDDNEQSTTDESLTNKKKKRRLKMSLADIVETTKSASEKAEKKRPFSFTLPEVTVKKEESVKTRENETETKEGEDENRHKLEINATINESQDELVGEVTDSNTGVDDEQNMLPKDEENSHLHEGMVSDALESPIIEINTEAEPLLPVIEQKDVEIKSGAETSEYQENDFQGEITIPHRDASFFHDEPESSPFLDPAIATGNRDEEIAPQSIEAGFPAQEETVGISEEMFPPREVEDEAMEDNHLSAHEIQNNRYMTDEERQFLLTTAPYQNAEFINPNMTQSSSFSAETTQEQQPVIVKRSGFWQGAMLGWLFGRRGKKNALEALKLKQNKLEKDKRDAEDYAAALLAKNTKQNEILEARDAFINTPFPVIEKKENVETPTSTKPEELTPEGIAIDQAAVDQKTELRTSAWHSYEVNPTTGALVEKSQIEYGPAFEQEIKHEAFIEPSLEYNAETGVLSKAQKGLEVTKGDSNTISPETVEFLKDKQRQELIRFTVHKMSSNMANGSLWVVGFVVAIVIVVATLL